MTPQTLELVIEELERLKSSVALMVGGQQPLQVARKPFAMPLQQFMRSLIIALRENHRDRTAEAYTCALNSFMRHVADPHFGLSEITSSVMQRYESHLRGHGLSPNTTSFHMRILRAVYHQAVERGLTVDRRPFAQVYTGVAKTPKRAIAPAAVRAIRDYVTDSSALCFARDMFMFSFYTRGMSWVDMAYLTRDSVHHGMLTYRRHKTGQTLSIRWEECMERIVNRYRPSNTIYLLPIIGRSNGKERNQYRCKQSQVNCSLKTIAHAIGLKTNLTMYVARHSWASMAQALGTPIDIISRGMGHTSSRTTQVYLQSLCNDKIDALNASIIGGL